MSASDQSALRHLVIVLGDQLDDDSAAFEGFDARRDAIWMAEAPAEADHVWSHKARIALFLAAMRHFRDRQRRQKRTVHYRTLDDPRNRGTLEAELAAAIEGLSPQRLVMVEPGEWRIQQVIEETARRCKVELEVRPDGHFLCSREQFARHAEERRRLRMEFFYREMRRQHDVLMDGNQPVGGQWNYDSSNRRSFGAEGPGEVPAHRSFRPDAGTRQVLALVAEWFADHPGSLEHFDWPVTRKQAEQALDDFIAHRLVSFGDYQDAMWTDQPVLYHARVSAALNLKLLNPRRVIHAAERAWREGRAPLNAVEGFIRQVLGWREYVRGVYWLLMPDYLERNTLGAELPLPGFYWTAETDMHCLQQVIGQTMDRAYAHHIQRLMVTGLFALLLGVHPKHVHEWYLAVYADAVEWVELPNTLGMSQYADDGVMASKPYAASGKYIRRMSNYCDACLYDPNDSTGQHACPFTTLYWDLLIRHQKTLRDNPRMKMQVRNLDRLNSGKRAAIRRRANQLRAALTA